MELIYFYRHKTSFIFPTRAPKSFSGLLGFFFGGGEGVGKSLTPDLATLHTE